MLEYMFSHSFWGWCAWDLPALLVLVVIALRYLLHCCRMKEREEDLEEELAEFKRDLKGAGAEDPRIT